MDEKEAKRELVEWEERSIQERVGGKERTENDYVSSHAKQSFSFEVQSGERVSSPSGAVDVSPFC